MRNHTLTGVVVPPDIESTLDLVSHNLPFVCMLITLTRARDLGDLLIIVTIIHISQEP